jgi:hypothetical protein
MATDETPLKSDALRDRRRELAEAGARAQSLAGPLSGRQLWWRPAPGRWSIGECLDHLCLADEAYLEVLDQAIESGRAAGCIADGPPRRSLIGNALVHGVEPPARVKIPAPRRIRPRHPDEHAEDTTAPGDPLARFLDLRRQIGRRLTAADGLALGRVRVRSPFVPLISVTLDTALRIVTGHERRHLAQAEAVAESDGFPARGEGGPLKASRSTG